MNDRLTELVNRPINNQFTIKVVKARALIEIAVALERIAIAKEGTG